MIEQTDRVSEEDEIDREVNGLSSCPPLLSHHHLVLLLLDTDLGGNMWHWCYCMRPIKSQYGQQSHSEWHITVFSPSPRSVEQ